MTLSDDIKRVLELDSKRTQGDWLYTPDSHVIWCSTLKGSEQICQYAHCHRDAPFIASAPLMASIIRQQQELLREAYEHLIDPNIEPWMPVREAIIAKIKTALGDV